MAADRRDTNGELFKVSKSFVKKFRRKKRLKMRKTSSIDPTRADA